MLLNEKLERDAHYFMVFSPYRYPRHNLRNMKNMCVCMYAKSLWLCLTLWDPMDCSPPGSSVHGILQARILEWVANPFPRGSSQPRDWTCISWSSSIAGGFFTIEPLGKPNLKNIVKCNRILIDLSIWFCLPLWVGSPRSAPTPGKQPPRKRSPGTAFRPGWETLFTGSKASEPPEGK